MPGLVELQAWRASLEAARRSGALTVCRPDGEAVTYRSDEELRAALADTDCRIMAIEGRVCGSQIRIRFSIQSMKGV